MNWSFDSRIKKPFLTRNEVNEIWKHLSILRSHKAITVDERHVILTITKIGYDRWWELRRKIDGEPRRLAQRFIANKNVRELIFGRDGGSCLNPKCTHGMPLSVDHIVPVSRNGGNSLNNLQTLCSSCNSSKGSKIIDYRKGGIL